MARTMIETTCENCGKKFMAVASRIRLGHSKNCSLECSYAIRGKKNATKFQVNCERCGKPFYTTPSVVAKGHGRYCSRECKNPVHITTCKNCGKEFRYSPSTEQQFCSKDCAYQSDERSQQSRQNTLNAWNNPEKRAALMDGIQRRSESEEWRSAAHFQKGEKNPNYKGNRKARTGMNLYEYRKWRTSVFKKCNYTCQQCGKQGIYLEAHHVKAWADHPESRFDVSNGIALCEDCHLSVHGKKRKPKTRICPHCGSEFRVKKPHQKYCTRLCFFDSIRRR